MAEHIGAMGNFTLPAEWVNNTYLISQFGRTAATQAGWQAAAMFLTLGMTQSLISSSIISPLCHPSQVWPW